MSNRAPPPSSYNQSGRLWVPATDCLVRFWAGRGFAYDACAASLDAEEKVDKRCASAVFREMFTSICEDSAAEANQFLNQLINHVNWTASEFDQSLEEIRGADDNITQDVHEYYRKCMVYFELTANLLRLLEATVMDGKILFFGRAESVMNLERVVQLMVHMIDRTNHSDLYDAVMETHHMTLSGLKKELLLSPIYGTIMSLMKCDGNPIDSTANQVTKIILDNGRLHPELLVSDGIAALSGMAEDELEMLDQFTTQLKGALQKSAESVPERSGSVSSSGDDDATCTICYANDICATFEPCQHRSCFKCISRHLLNEKKCFFCNAVVDNVVRDVDDGAGTLESAAKANSGT